MEIGAICPPLVAFHHTLWPKSWGVCFPGERFDENSEAELLKKQREQKRKYQRGIGWLCYGKVPVCVFVDVSNKQKLSDSDTEQATAFQSDCSFFFSVRVRARGFVRIVPVQMRIGTRARRSSQCETAGGKAGGVLTIL